MGTRICHLEPFGALRINSVRDLSLPLLFSKEHLARQSRNPSGLELNHKAHKDRIDNGRLGFAEFTAKNPARQSRTKGAQEGLTAEAQRSQS